MDVKPDDAVLDELIRRRLDEILPQKIEEQLAARMDADGFAGCASRADAET